MKYLAFALVLIFVLHLIDKHDKWRGAFKILLGLIGIAVVAAVGLYGVYSFREWSQEKRQAVVKAQRDAAVQDCVKRFKNADVFDTVACQSDPSVQPQPYIVVGEEAVEPVRESSPHLKLVKNKASRDISLTTTELGSLKCATVKPGEIVSLLVEDGTQIRVKTKEGKIGWGDAGSFEVQE